MHIELDGKEITLALIRSGRRQPVAVVYRREESKLVIDMRAPFADRVAQLLLIGSQLERLSPLPAVSDLI